MQHFISDNASPAHPEVMNALMEVNSGYEVAYGQDRITEKAKQLFRKHFGECQVFFMSTGTACNVIALKSILESHEAVICADSAHLYKDECGAPEALLGVKLLTVKTPQGKLTPENISPLLLDRNMVHRVQPKAVSISQCTEWGTVYSIEELNRLSEFCHKHGLLLHVDGARLANAACHLNTSLREICLNGKIDLLSFGGTKNGLMGAEALIIFNASLAGKTPFIQKQFMQLSSKMRYLSAQFIALLNDNLWQKNADRANQMATLLAEQTHHDVDIIMPVETNVIFARLPKEVISPLQTAFPFAVWNSEKNIVRWMTSFDTQEQTVMAFAKKIKEVINDYS
ncbi:threonine aldolase family protein [Legionella israelensis]|uniref:Low specificity L-threonine aldolase n=1 Tax=Legionella israelensis TaxID=454 RepID=A0A0W0VK33_9GAMM|nr:low specificity L-threonine aldolase [Legionella israelensis]KTD20469.1 Low specificity L-threonine aldolase [Legionella israelensis]QBS10852.1 low specificity L-threonine aldolase [Legionella israelensis]SCX86903.1 L-threonine aldolase [Legionella israelensis DSM 19235]STX57830.1 Low specificity L-threonine aldolase [Legionella israelensis]